MAGINLIFELWNITNNRKCCLDEIAMKTQTFINDLRIRSIINQNVPFHSTSQFGTVCWCNTSLTSGLGLSLVLADCFRFSLYIIALILIVCVLCDISLFFFCIGVYINLSGTRRHTLYHSVVLFKFFVVKACFYHPTSLDNILKTSFLQDACWVSEKLMVSVKMAIC